MKKLPFVTAALVLGAALSTQADALVGQAAPDFTLTDSKGGSHKLSALKGKYVVLEWVNYECPFVGKHYGSGNMQKLQREYTAKGVTWLSVNSSAPGKQGHYTPAQVDAKSKERNAAMTAYLLDADGKVGRAYGARTTPHMFVIDPAGKLLYAGGIDDKPSTDGEDVKTAKNFVRAALDETMAGKPVTVASSQPYGCNVKY
jgi:peroxiredoxin